MDLPEDAAALLAAWMPGAQAALGDALVGLYLRGSLALGEGDPVMSDLDVFAVTAHPVTEAEFAALAALHTRLERLPNHFAGQMEGPYIDRAAARRFVPGQAHPTVYRGEPLARRLHGANWVLERWMVRERGVTLCGPDPRTLIDPITPDGLRSAVRARLPDWLAWAEQTDDPDWPLPLSHKAYVVETMCRALHTLATGELASKPQAVAWALATLPEPWRTTAARSRAWHAAATVDPSVVPEVRAFVRWATARAGV